MRHVTPNGRHPHSHAAGRLLPDSMLRVRGSQSRVLSAHTSFYIPTSAPRDAKLGYKRKLGVGRNTCAVSNSLLRGASNREGVCRTCSCGPMISGGSPVAVHWNLM